MKYSMEADKYRAYMPPSTLTMSMYPDPKYLDSSPKTFLDRSYLDSATKAYLEQSSKFYMDQKQDYVRHTSASYEPNKIYESESSPGGAGSLSRSPAADSPDTLMGHKTQNSTGPGESRSNDLSSSASSSASTSSPGTTLPPYYTPGAQGPASLLSPQMAQYASYQGAPAPGNEFRRPVTVIF